MQPGIQRFFVLFPLALLLVLARLHPVMLASCIPLTVSCCALLAARHWLAGDRGKAWLMAPIMGAATGLVLWSVSAGLIHAAAAGCGIPLALMLQRRWPYGWRLTLVSALAFAMIGGTMLANWKDVREFVTQLSNARINELAENGISADQAVEFMKWWDVNYAYLGPGSVFGTVLFLSAFLLSVLDRWQRTPEAAAKRKPSGFQRMQLPDWAVWIAIAVAVLWFAEQRWPNEALRAVTWNSAIGLVFVYWLNGYSILLYALTVFKASAFATFMVFSGFVLFSGMLPALSVLGLFDTWYDFRMRCRRLALFRHLSYRANNRDS